MGTQPNFDLVRLLVRALLGRRLPSLDGHMRIDGIESAVQIVRDQWGVPHVEAASDADAFFALGFCLGQDRGFQMEMLLRAARGTVAALAGPPGVPVDRLSRRIGFHRAASAQLRALDPGIRERVEAYARGVSAGLRRGARRRPHELAMAMRSATAWDAPDVLAVGKLISFGLALNWELELARLKVLDLDGPDALRAVDPAYPSWLTVVSPPGRSAGPAIDRLAGDVASLRQLAPIGASNAWVIGPRRSRTGRPLLANDPHVYPALPPLTYLAHLKTPEWQLLGATMPGLCGVVTGHNGFAAWGVTNAAADCVDLFIEEVGPDGASVRGADGWTACDVLEERIDVRGRRRPLVERVLVTPRGPIVSPALSGEHPALSMSAVFLEPQPIEGYLRLERVRSFEELRDAFRAWPSSPLNLLYADESGSIGWLFAAQLPRRRGNCFGLLPQPGWASDSGWDGLTTLDEMPSLTDPDCSFIVSANNQPISEGGGDDEPFLGVDWADGYRAQRISEAIEGGERWDVGACLALQLDKVSIPWLELREPVLAAADGGDARVMRAASLLRDWDGVVGPESPAAAIFELALAELAQRYARERAPNGADWALGRGDGPLNPHSFAAIRWTGHLSRLIRGRDEALGPRAIADSLGAAVESLERLRGPEPSDWGWGAVRPLTLRHPLGDLGPLARVFDLGPIPYGGDASTADSAPPPPLDPTGDPVFTPLLRAAIDVGDWGNSRWILAGGQSGNPFSPHYRDQFALWREGQAVRIPWTAEGIRATARHTLELVPATPRGGRP